MPSRYSKRGMESRCKRDSFTLNRTARYRHGVCDHEPAAGKAVWSTCLVDIPAEAWRRLADTMLASRAAEIAGADGLGRGREADHVMDDQLLLRWYVPQAPGFR